MMGICIVEVVPTHRRVIVLRQLRDVLSHPEMQQMLMQTIYMINAVVANAGVVYLPRPWVLYAWCWKMNIPRPSSPRCSTTSQAEVRTRHLLAYPWPIAGDGANEDEISTDLCLRLLAPEGHDF